jgi:hypothetical protein
LIERALEKLSASKVLESNDEDLEVIELVSMEGGTYHSENSTLTV